MMYGQSRALFRVVMVISTEDKALLQPFCQEGI